MMTPTAIAHNVKTAEDVAATFHLEPDHNPRAGEPSRVWFALTKVGGVVIPLADCDCQLAVVQNGQPIAPVLLKPIDAEQYQGIPGGDFAFPQVGIYQLVFSGKAKGAAQFKPFELKYEVTVQPGKTTVQPPPQASAVATQNTFTPASSRDFEFAPWLVGFGLGLTGVGLGTLAWRVLRRGKGRDREDQD